MSNTKKIALMSTLVLLLAVTAIFNFVLAGARTPDVQASTAVKVNYFTAYRAERSTTRSEEFIQLDNIIAAFAEGTPEHTQAVAEKQRMIELMEDELIMESIVKTIGFSDAAVAISSKNNISVFVNTNELSPEMMKRIYNAFQREYDIRNGELIIVPVYAES